MLILDNLSGLNLGLPLNMLMAHGSEATAGLCCSKGGGDANHDGERRGSARGEGLADREKGGGWKGEVEV